MEKFDIVLPMGPACRPAFQIQKAGYRKRAYPMDWQIFALDGALQLFKNHFEDFFAKYEDMNKITKYGFRTVKDTKNDITSIHHVRSDIPLDEAINEFRTLMLKRYNNLNSDLRAAKNLLIVAHHEDDLDSLIKFITEFSKLYPHLKITFANVYSVANKDEKKVVKINDKLTIAQYFFNDINKNGSTEEENPKYWTGNDEKWQEMLHEYAVSYSTTTKK